VTAECNECNEALDAARQAVAAARRLAMVADNAIANGDLRRARAALRDLQDTVAVSSCEFAPLCLADGERDRQAGS
jgi:hypothetical protein